MRASEIDDPVGDGQRAAREARARAAGDERDAVAGAEPDDGLHLLRRARQHDARRLRAPAGEAVAVVRRELLRLGDHVVVADRRPELVDEAAQRAARDDPTAATGSDSIDDR